MFLRWRREDLGFVYFYPKPKIFEDSPLHRIFRRMHGVLNIDKNKKLIA